MVDDHQKAEISSIEQQRWIGGSTFVRQIDDFYDLDDPINQ